MCVLSKWNLLERIFVVDPITLALIIGAKVALARPVGQAIDEHFRNKALREADEKKKLQEALENEARQLGCSVDELPERKMAIARAKELNCSLSDLPRIESELQRRRQLESEWQRRVAAAQELEKQKWIEEQMKK